MGGAEEVYKGISATALVAGVWWHSDRPGTAHSKYIRIRNSSSGGTSAQQEAWVETSQEAQLGKLMDLKSTQGCNERSWITGNQNSISKGGSLQPHLIPKSLSPRSATGVTRDGGWMGGWVGFQLDRSWTFSYAFLLVLMRGSMYRGLAGICRDILGHRTPPQGSRDEEN